MCAKLLSEIEDEITTLLSELIKINTTNPPGNEIQAAKFLAKNLEKDGFKCELFESDPGRGSVVTRLKGAGDKPSLLLLSHLDVVAANPKEWSVNPFSGAIFSSLNTCWPISLNGRVNALGANCALACATRITSHRVQFLEFVR